MIQTLILSVQALTLVCEIGDVGASFGARVRISHLCLQACVLTYRTFTDLKVAPRNTYTYVHFRIPSTNNYLPDNRG